MLNQIVHLSFGFENLYFFDDDLNFLIFFKVKNLCWVLIMLAAYFTIFFSTQIYFYSESDSMPFLNGFMEHDHSDFFYAKIVNHLASCQSESGHDSPLPVASGGQSLSLECSECPERVSPGHLRRESHI